MPKDIREILKERIIRKPELAKGHRDRFKIKLVKDNVVEKKNYSLLKIAAAILILISLGYYFKPDKSINSVNNSSQTFNLETVSPEMKQIENYYLTAINYELASIELSSEHKTILNQYLEKIANLTKQYSELTDSLKEEGLNEKTINALITNLQLRLHLLLELKDTLQDLKTPNKTKNEDIKV
jgi:hypothetical protein